ncbi:serine/threonine-protein kinase [Actinomadura xylanilytica]|uniref:serine/threonine-protein kinase n=1 Tax=Actinomadura xylanilytica TaxID=887459 RepID=UPI00255ABDD6|nr:serine/threonine-protein kinase [Actinomadura xylanilytica]MDL4777476.1 serine/threonine-protein kinase [Actinomadura xylanilytica]
MTTHAGENTLRPEDPRELGPYRLIARLGRGGMGTVFLGEDGSGRRVAVKVINRELAGETAFLDRFRQEVTAARQVRRFCTAPVIDAELDRQPPYVVTEYIEGPSLEHAVAERGPLPGSDLEGLAVGVATALAAIHAAGIVHRDLKPANVLLSATGPRVIDFGIARALDAADGPTRTGQFIGTPAYIAPEILRGEPVTAASDVFSWGCVVAYAGTGSAPFTGVTVPEIFYRVAHGDPVLDGLDAGLRDIVAAALDKDPRNRPSNQELLSRLVGHARPDPAQLAETVQAGWHGAMPPPPQAPQAPQIPQAPMPPPPPTGGYPQSGPTAMLGHDATRGDPRPARAEGPGTSRRPLLIGAAALAAVVLVGAGAYALFGSDGPPGDTASFYETDFASGQSGWYGDNYTESSGQGVQNGHYRIDLKSNNSAGFTLAASPVDDTKQLPKQQLVTAQVTPASGPNYGQFGLFCRGSKEIGEEGGYQFLIRRDGKGSLIRKVSPVVGAKELATGDDAGGYEAPEAGKPGRPSKVQIACEEQDGGKKVRLRLWVNGDLAASATDSDQVLPNRNSGLIVTRISETQETLAVDYDDFEIAEIKG